MLSLAVHAVMRLPLATLPTAGGHAVLNLAMDAPARGPEPFARVGGVPAGSGADDIATRTTRPEALPC
ncbi:MULTISPECIES: hypothetical protein [unclassified Streptomyces]|uniref:hypothetical protein n=1 Tax=unclassified Streptomyces TaxID=2593676 RepID=UPI0035DD6045